MKWSKHLYSVTVSNLYGEEKMYKMTQKEFDELTKDVTLEIKKGCSHPEVVRINDDYTGAHIDYGCTRSGMMHTNRDAFQKGTKF